VVQAVRRVLRGEIYWADLEPVRGREQAGVRPVVILSRTTFNERSQTVIAMAITSQPQRAGYPLTWRVPPGELPCESWVKITQLRTLAVERLGQRIGRLDEQDMSALVDGLLQTIR
jgi:mRNA interferase MazF